MLNRTQVTGAGTGQSRWNWTTLRAITKTLTRRMTTIIDRVRLTIDQMRRPAEHNHRDRLCQILNLVFAIGQVVTTYLTVATGADEQFSNRATIDEYTFPVIWSIMYASTTSYAIYQALPQEHENELLRRIGFWTAAAFAGTSLWLVAVYQAKRCTDHCAE